MKKKTKFIILITVTILIAMVFIVVMMLMIKKNGECIDDPFRYSAIRLKESGGDYSCKCTSLNSSLLDFSFSEEGIEIIRATNYEDINFSDLEIVVKGGD